MQVPAAAPRGGAPLAVDRAAEGRNFPTWWLCFGNGEIVEVEIYEAAMRAGLVA